MALVSRDLSTSERVQSLQASHMAESTQFRQLQLVIFIMGLFHLKMACADTLWKMFIQLKNAKYDETSLLRYVTEIRP
ncbi:hypothetical protein C8Q77DRAFT_1062437 [Trametes polyzona]|nr:hypothetical protein C8Q77DRAFT_1062437 [Trametes polyzona]